MPVLSRLLALTVIAVRLQAQAPTTAPAAASIGSPADERARMRELLGRDSLGGNMLRSLSRTPRGWVKGEQLHVTLLRPVFETVQNTALPFWQNGGSVQPSVGGSGRLTVGVQWQVGALRAILAPELVDMRNARWMPLDPRWWSPPMPADQYSPWASPWNLSPWTAPALTRSPYGIDLPLRYGDKPIQRMIPGQSALWLEHDAVAFGYSTENEWWGPGIRNALLLSNNAPGFGHAFVRTARPLRTPWGAIEANVLLGTLRESPFFDFDSTNNRRSLSGAIVVMRPSAVPGLEVGVARLVMSPLPGRESAAEHAFDVFSRVGRPNALPTTDFSRTPGRDQLASLFFRYVLPRDGVEVYGEFGRAEEPINLRDFLTEPNHSLGSTLGVQYARPMGSGILRLQAERTFVEQSPTYTHRPMGSWYTSRAIQQGFTHDGKVLGAAIGPGSSSQWIALDYFAPTWRIGSFFGRHRFNNDAFYTMPWILGPQGFCEFDTSIYPGVRGSAVLGGREVAWNVTYLTRLNIGFQNNSGCPSPPGVLAHDGRSWSVGVSWWPFTR